MFDKEKYILQFGSLAGWPYQVAKELRNRGINSKNAIRWYSDVHDLKRNLPFDDYLTHPNSNIFLKARKIFEFISSASKECSIIHYHGTNIFFREIHHLYEGPIFKKANIPMLLTFGGGDVRRYKIANNLNPYFYRQNSFFHDLKIKMRLNSWSKNIRFCATTEEMFPHIEKYFEKVFIFRQPADLEALKPKYPDVSNKIPIILHTPTEPQVKGTKYVLETIDKLKKAGLNFEFKLKRNMTQEETHREISKCDIYLDELLTGGYGVTAIESMALGKPTISWVLKSIQEISPEGLPIVSANPDNLEKKLTNLILDPDQRYEIGIQSRKYVEKYHDLKKVTQDLIKVYQEIL